MQKNKKAKTSTIKEIAPLVIAGAVIGAGLLSLNYMPQIDYNQDGVYSALEHDLTGGIFAIAVTLPTMTAVAVYVAGYNDRMGQKNKADSYGHVKAV